MIDLIKVDLSRLNERSERYVTEFGFTAQEVTINQAGLLEKELVEQSPPKNLKKSQERAEDFTRNVFATKPVDTPLLSKNASGSQIVWLSSGPKFLLGVDRKDFKDKISAEQMRPLYYRKAKRKNFGVRYKEIGRRGTQHVMKLSRIVVSKGALRTFQKGIREGFGKLKASWAIGWDVLKVKGTLPLWIRKHLGNSFLAAFTGGQALGRIVLNLSYEKPSVTLISNAKGVESQRELQVIRGAIVTRIEKMKVDLKLYAAGIKKKAGFKNS